MDDLGLVLLAFLGGCLFIERGLSSIGEGIKEGLTNLGKEIREGMEGSSGDKE